VATVAQVLALAWQNHQAGNFAQAEQLYRRILQNDPSHADAWGYLGSACQAQGNLAEAERSFRRVVQLLPGNASAHNCLAVVLVHKGKLDEAAASLQEALRCQPENAEIHNNLGSVLARLGRATEAMDSYRQALRLAPDNAQAHYNLGLALKTAGQQVAALAEFQEALRCQPDFAEAMQDRGDVLVELKKLEAAESSYRQALGLRPNRAETHHNLGITLESQGRLDEAMVSYQQALGLNPNFAEAHFSLGNALQRQGRFEEAVARYRQVLQLNSNFAEGHSNLGQALLALGRLADASACFRRALELKPESAAIHVNLAGALKEQGQLEVAVACYRRALQLQPDHPGYLAELVHQLQHVCLWKDLGRLSQRLLEVVQKDATHGLVAPFTLLALPTSVTAAELHQCASRWVEQRLRFVRSPKSKVQSQDIAHRTSHIAHRRITVGYLSADFHEHATAYLIAELIEKHDRQRFEVFGYSYGPDDGSSMRRRLLKSFDRFANLKDASFSAAARRIETDGVDILVDLKGHTRYARTQIPALRPAPIQVSYLGYPGTMAAPFIDYILVDGFVVPPDQQPFFTEKLVYLPGCYQVNDSTREIGSRTPSRAECGLPEAGFIFCCFNNSFKITPEVFEVWMQLLKTVPGSVLWLLEDNALAPVNLRGEAEARGVTADRLVFAPRLALPEHLARHRLADLFLDTHPYNAHTTASDALWAGCPLLTMAGQTFPSRVAGSLLRTLGLPELITTSLQEYEEMALRLARDVECLNGLRARLQANRATSGLFDGGRFARDLEQAYVTMWEVYTSGKEARPFSVPHQPEARAR